MPLSVLPQKIAPHITEILRRCREQGTVIEKTVAV